MVILAAMPAMTAAFRALEPHQASDASPAAHRPVARIERRAHAARPR
jgi:hypothetical protein